MSVEARLQALVQNYRAQHGDAGLHNSPQLVAQLSVQAPDLYGEIRALSAAMAGNAAARIAAAPDQDGEAGRVAAEIAGSEKLSMAVATAGVAVARAIGPVGQAAPAIPPAPPAVGGWAGDSVAVGAPPPQQPHGQPPAGGYVPPGSVPPPGQASTPIHKNPVALAAVAAVALLGGYYVYTQRDPAPKSDPVANGQQGPLAGGPQSGPAPSRQGPAAPPGGTQQGAADPFPRLVSSGDLPVLAVNSAPNGLAVPFSIETQAGPALGAVILPTSGWEGGPATVIFGAAGDTTGEGQVVNQGSAQMQRLQGQTAGRIGQVQWQRDGLNLGPICVAFVGQAGRNGDIGLSGTTMCVADATCESNAICGRVGQMRR